MTLMSILGLKGGMANEMDAGKTRKRGYNQSQWQKYLHIKIQKKKF
jgi:hypothetical protein